MAKDIHDQPQEAWFGVTVPSEAVLEELKDVIAAYVLEQGGFLHTVKYHAEGN